MLTLTQDSVPGAVARSVCGGAVAEHYFALVHWLRSGGDTNAVVPKTIGVTSCARGAGVSTVASNLAITAAQVSEQPVLLLDLSTTRSTLAARLGVAGDLGLRSALSHESRPGDCAKASRIANLSLLAMNEPGEAQGLSVDGVKVRELLPALERDFGLVIIDLPPTESNLCFTTAGLLDGVLLVMEAERTRCEEAAHARQRLMYANATVLGVILNKHPQHIPHWLDARL